MAKEVQRVPKLRTEGGRSSFQDRQRKLQQVWTMQENEHEGSVGATAPDDQGVDRVLESPHRLTIVHDGNPVATLENPTVPPKLRDKDGMVWLVHTYEYLAWKPLASQLMLSGASAQMLLGSEYILTRGAHRQHFHPRPGMDAVTVVQVLENPRALGIEDTFLVVAG